MQLELSPEAGFETPQKLERKSGHNFSQEKKKNGPREKENFSHDDAQIHLRGWYWMTR